MKFGVREICDVFLKAKVDGQKVGSTEFKAGQPVCHFDSLKTSTVEGAATTVYAQGGKGNPRLIAWEGERTLTFTMEDALISKMGIAILTGADLINAAKLEGNKTMPMHVSAKITSADKKVFELKDEKGTAITIDDSQPIYYSLLDADGDPDGVFEEVISTGDKKNAAVSSGTITFDNALGKDSILLDCYTQKTANLSQIDITPDQFGGNYYLEASTLFRNTDGKDYAAEFIIPNCKVQSNFTFTMASSGDPSTFTYTIDAFPGATKHDPTKKVLCSIQMYDDDVEAASTAKPTSYGSRVEI